MAPFHWPVVLWTVWRLHISETDHQLYGKDPLEKIIWKRTEGKMLKDYSYEDVRSLCDSKCTLFLPLREQSSCCKIAGSSQVCYETFHRPQGDANAEARDGVAFVPRSMTKLLCLRLQCLVEFLNTQHIHSADYPRVAHCPSPTLTAQRLIRELQDAEYLAALQSDREKELKAVEEAELRRLEEVAARESAIEKQKQENEDKLKTTRGRGGSVGII